MLQLLPRRSHRDNKKDVKVELLLFWRLLWSFLPFCWPFTASPTPLTHAVRLFTLPLLVMENTFGGVSRSLDQIVLEICDCRQHARFHRTKATPEHVAGPKHIPPKTTFSARPRPIALGNAADENLFAQHKFLIFISLF